MADLIKLANLIILLSIVVGYPLLAIFALIALHKRKLPGIATAIWALIILCVPFFGALALWIIKPKRDQQLDRLNEDITTA